VQVNLLPLRAVRPVRTFFAFTLLGTAVLIASEHANAQQSASVAISVKDHRFQPSQISAPANRPISIKVKNLDTAPMEFESVSLRVEKVIAPGSEGVVNVRALAPGRYEFFDDFHQETRGTLVVE
jgi:heme/copper-type cytochrome/quinol oxidase subunit 2